VELTNEQRFEVIKEINKLTENINNPEEYAFVVLFWIRKITLEFQEELLEKVGKNA